MSAKVMFGTFGAMFLLRHVDQEDPNVLLYTRVMYLTYVLLSVCLHTFLHFRVTFRRDETLIQVPVSNKPKSFSDALSAEQRAREQRQPSTEPDTQSQDTSTEGAPTDASQTHHRADVQSDEQEKPKMERITIMEYDLRHLASTRNSFIANCCILAAIHYKMQSVSSLVLSVVTGIMNNFFEDRLVAIHVRGCPAVGRLARPFKAPENQLSAMLKMLVPTPPALDPSQSTAQTQQTTAEDLHDDGDDDDDDDDGPRRIADLDDADITSDFVEEDNEAKKDK